MNNVISFQQFLSPDIVPVFGNKGCRTKKLGSEFEAIII